MATWAAVGMVTGAERFEERQRDEGAAKLSATQRSTGDASSISSMPHPSLVFLAMKALPTRLTLGTPGESEVLGALQSSRP